MFKMLAQLWTTLSRFLSAAEKVAISLDTLADIGVSAATNLKEELNLEHQAKINQLRAAQVPAITVQP